jgi:hypothetical protein
MLGFLDFKKIISRNKNFWCPYQIGIIKYFSLFLPSNEVR